MTEQELINTLQLNRLACSPSEVNAFENALAALVKQPNVKLLPGLFLVFSDASEHQEVMWGLLHFIEAFDVEEVIQTFVQILPSLITQAPEWSKTITHRVLNSEKTRSLFRTVLNTLPTEIQASVRLTLQHMSEQDNNFKDKIDTLLRI